MYFTHIFSIGLISGPLFRQREWAQPASSIIICDTEMAKATLSFNFFCSTQNSTRKQHSIEMQNWSDVSGDTHRRHTECPDSGCQDTQITLALCPCPSETTLSAQKRFFSGNANKHLGGSSTRITVGSRCKPHKLTWKACKPPPLCKGEWKRLYQPWLQKPPSFSSQWCNFIQGKKEKAFEWSKLYHDYLKIHTFSFTEKCSYMGTAQHMKAFPWKQGQSSCFKVWNTPSV